MSSSSFPSNTTEDVINDDNSDDEYEYEYEYDDDDSPRMMINEKIIRRMQVSLKLK